MDKFTEVILVFFASFIIVYFYLNIKWHLNEKTIISLKESLDLVNLPIVTFNVNEHKVRFVLDSGSQGNFINKETAKILELEEVEGHSFCVVHTLSGKEEQERKKIVANIKYADETFLFEGFPIDLTDLMNQIRAETGVTIHGILGNEFLKKHKYVLDFDKLQCYYDKKH